MRKFLLSGLTFAAAFGATAAFGQQDLAATYGTRAPRTCPTRAGPTSGPPTADQARQYMICDGEIVTDGLHLFTNVTVQVGNGRPYNPDTDSNVLDAVDPARTVYPIRASYTDYTCYTPHDATYLGGGAGRNCHRAVDTDMVGACFQNSFGDWHCAGFRGGRQVVDPGWPLPMYAPPADG